MQLQDSTQEFGRSILAQIYANHIKVLQAGCCVSQAVHYYPSLPKPQAIERITFCFA